jgi:hypothetical protein
VRRAVALTLVLAVILVFAFSAVALAAPCTNNGADNGLKGDDCVIGLKTICIWWHEVPIFWPYDTPGQAFQGIREVTGLNPAQFASLFHMTTGEYLYYFSF